MAQNQGPSMFDIPVQMAYQFIIYIKHRSFLDPYIIMRIGYQRNQPNKKIKTENNMNKVLYEIDNNNLS